LRQRQTAPENIAGYCVGFRSGFTVTLSRNRSSALREPSVRYTGARNARRRSVTKGFTTYRYRAVSILGLIMYALLAGTLAFTVVVVL